MWSRKSADRRLNSELQFHLEQLVHDYIAAGMDPLEARRRARMEFGGVEQIKEECRDVHGMGWLRDLSQDLRYASRMLRRSPGFLAVATLSLALGIGANTAIFSLIDAIMLRSMPVQEPQRLVQFQRLRAGRPGNFSYPLFDYFREHSRSFSGMFAEECNDGMDISFQGTEEKASVELVSGSYTGILGLQPAAGRLLRPDDDGAPGGSPVAVISHRYWQRRFNADPSAIGKFFTFRSTVFRIVGVAPPEFFGTRAGRDPDIAVPLSMYEQAKGVANIRQRDGYNTLWVMARLKPGVTLHEAEAEVRVLFEGKLRDEAGGAPNQKERSGILRQSMVLLPAAAGFDDLRKRFSQPLLVLMGIVMLVLLLACANLSSLLLARAASRHREISIRRAIGAGRGRLVRQFLAESLLLVLLGGAGGLLMARWFCVALVSTMANGGALLLPVQPDWRILLFASAISMLSSVVVGLAPGLHAARANVSPGLKEVRGGSRHHLGKTLMIAQLAISMVLVVSASLFVGTLIKLYSLDAGFRREGILTFRLQIKQKYTNARALAMHSQLLERLNSLPRVTSASAASNLMIGGGLDSSAVTAEGHTARTDEFEMANLNWVAPGFFETTATPLLFGREFEARDAPAAGKVAIVNESFARYFFPNASPLGKHVSAAGGATAEIVGVVKDAKYSNLREPFPRTVYFNLLQNPASAMSATYLLHVSAGSPLSLAQAVGRIATEIDPALRLSSTESFNERIDRSTLNERIMATLGGFFGVLALVVASIGIFGVMAFQVSRRINELGVRMALGASRSDIIVLVMRDVAAMLIAGSAIGTIASLAFTGFAAKLLFGVGASDAKILALSAAILALATFTAAWLPVRRASRVDPMTALRHE